MALSPRLNLTQTQNLRLTAQLTQAIGLLQLSHVELAARVAEEVEKNPILELERPRAVPSGFASSGGEDFDKAASVADTLSLRAHLLSQISSMRAAPRRRALAEALVDELTDEGRLDAPLFEIADRYGVVTEEVEGALALLQSCDPPGIGARNLGECFVLQLHERELLDPAMMAICQNLADLAGPRRADLRRRTGLDEEEFDARLALLRTLDPRPGLAYAEREATPVVPDVFVRRSSEAWQVELNSDALPRVLVNDSYASEMSAAGGEAERFIMQCRTRAGWLTKALESRAQNLLKVSEIIVKRQTGFFEEGDVALRPLMMKDVAAEVGVHESTVSRIAANKYIASQQGLRELRAFFAQGVPGADGAPGHAPAAVQSRLRRLIDGEDPARPLSDDRLVGKLREDGVDIARRTVAKYREAMGIPSSVQRRRLKATSLRP